MKNAIYCCDRLNQQPEQTLVFTHRAGAIVSKEQAEIGEGYSDPVESQVGNSHNRPRQPITKYYGIGLIYCYASNPRL